MRRLAQLDGSNRRFLAGGSAAFLLGLTIIVLTVVSIVHEGTETDRLRATGVPVTGTVIDWSGGNRTARTDRIDLGYLHAGEPYLSTVHCRGFSPCYVETGGTIQLWVDPRHPEHFATEFGNTDGSTSWFTSIGMLVPGFALALLGGAMTYSCLTATEKPQPNRRRRRRRRAKGR